MRKSKSKFDSLFDATRPQAEAPPEPEATPTPPAPPEQLPGERRGPGRPATGKRSNPAYQPITVYVLQDVYIEAQKKLLDERSKRDMSDVITTLLAQWVDEA